MAYFKVFCFKKQFSFRFFKCYLERKIPPSFVPLVLSGTQKNQQQTPGMGMWRGVLNAAMPSVFEPRHLTSSAPQWINVLEQMSWLCNFEWVWICGISQPRIQIFGEIASVLTMCRHFSCYYPLDCTVYICIALTLYQILSRDN